MKTLKTITVALTLNLAFASVALADSVCEAYAKDEGVKVVKSVEAYGNNALTQEQKAMIQSVVLLLDLNKPVDADSALSEFSDAKWEGSNGGSLTYVTVPYRDGVATVIRVTYYPGDNEYGLLFRQYSEGYAFQIGTIGDGDVSCLTYQ